MIFKNAEELIANGQTSQLKQKRQHMLEIFSAALYAVDPYNAVQQQLSNHQIKLKSSTLDASQYNHVYIIAFGKASVKMTQAIADNLTIKEGVVITNDQNAKLEYDNIDLIVGGHPLPNQGSILGAEKCLNLIKECTSQDLLLILISGGGSALLSHPKIPLNDLQDTTKQLLHSGATINEINTIRKHLSNVKGGQLIHNTPGTVVSFIISDIVGDPIDFIASGPTTPDSSTYTDAYNILKKYHLINSMPQSTVNIILKGAQGKIPETPKPNNPVFQKTYNVVIANNEKACRTALEKANLLGYGTYLFSTSISGEAKDVGIKLYQEAVKHFNEKNNRVLISGGEPTVTVHGHGNGGRNQELILSCIKLLADKENTVMGSFATDGIDGSCDAAGALIDTYSYQRAKKLHLNPLEFLNDNNSYKFFKALGDTFLTGPTGTNVMDIQLIIL